MRAVVTGGAGFIGSNLVDALVARGDEVTVVDNFASGKRENLNPEATLLEHDIREPFDARRTSSSISPRRPTCRPRCSAPIRRGGERRRHGQRARGASPERQVIFSSSGGAGYGECPVPAAEDAPFLPLSPYGIAKKCGEEYLLGWNRIHGTRTSSLRFANVYGPRQDAGLEGGVVAIFLERLARGEPTTIFGDGAQSRDFVYVGDVVAALLAAVGKSGGAVQRRHRRRRRRSRDCTTRPRRSPASSAAPRFEEARLGDVHRSVLDVGAHRARARLARRRPARRRPAHTPGPGRQERAGA